LALNGGEWLTSQSGCFTLAKELQYPWNRRLGGTQSWSGHFVEEKSLMLPILTTLFQLQHMYEKCVTVRNGHITLNNKSVENIFILHIVYCVSNEIDKVYLPLYKFSKPE
jgi:hypothetical protein